MHWCLGGLGSLHTFCIRISELSKTACSLKHAIFVVYAQAELIIAVSYGREGIRIQ